MILVNYTVHKMVQKCKLLKLFWQIYVQSSSVLSKITNSVTQDK